MGGPLIFKPTPTGYGTQGYTTLKLGESIGSCKPSPIYYHEPKHWYITRCMRGGSYTYSSTPEHQGGPFWSGFPWNFKTPDV
jgi:hypothetical protein